MKKLTPQTQSKNAICFIGDSNRNYIKIANVAIQSTIDNCGIESPEIVIITGSKNDCDIISEDLVEKLRKENAKIQLIDIHDYIDSKRLGGEVFKVPEWNNCISDIEFFRYFVPEIFKDYNRVLYIDMDIIVKKSLSEVFETKFSENEIVGACAEFEFLSIIPKKMNKKGDWIVPAEKYDLMSKKYDNSIVNYYKREIGIDKLYYNIGTMFFDIKKCLDFNYTEKCLLESKRIYDALGYLPILGQDVFNSVCRGAIHTLDVRFNLMCRYTAPYIQKIAMHRKGGNELVEKTISYASNYNSSSIVHYAGLIKPWKNPQVNYNVMIDWWKECYKTSNFSYFLKQFKSETIKNNILEKIKVQSKNTLDDLM